LIGRNQDDEGTYLVITGILGAGKLPLKAAFLEKRELDSLLPAGAAVTLVVK